MSFIPPPSSLVNRRKSGTQRIVLILAVVTYLMCFQWMYVCYLYPVWSYFGFDYNPPEAKCLMLAWTLCILPALWMPLQLTRPSQLAYWVLYITVIIPAIFVPVFVGLNPPGEIMLLILVIFAGFSIVGLSYRLPLLALRPAGISNAVFWKGFGCFAAVLVIWMVAVFHNHMRVVGFADVYDVRFAADDVSEGTNVNYTLMWMAGAIDPFLMACGLHYRRAWLFIAGVLGQVLVYSVLGTKGSILSAFFIPGIYLVFRAGRLPLGLKLMFGSLALVGAASLSYSLVGYNPSPLHTIALFVVLLRTFSGNGLVTAWYYDFFQHNPVTYYSHIMGVRWFVHYPYANLIGYEVGSHYMGANANLDATAHFWATDGLEALGLPGVLLISVFCVLVFWALDSAARRHDPEFGALVTAYGAYNLANLSLFTTLFSGGLGLLILFLYLMPRQARNPASAVMGNPALAPAS